MKKLLYSVLAAWVASISLFTATSCNNGETYAEQKDKEKRAIRKFLEDNDFVGAINVIDEAQFYAQDSLTDTAKNEFVLFGDDGIYMQIVRKGAGQTMAEMAKEMPDSTVSKVILCRFLEYDIESADTTYTNLYTPSIVDKMLCKYSCYSRIYSANFTEGRMYASYDGTTVPEGWKKPLNYIRLTRDAGQIAKVRLIVPHASGTLNATNYVLPFYYEITYQLGR